VISLLPNVIRPITRPAAPKNIIQNGICALLMLIPPDWIASLIATKGQIAFATSFAPCANDNNATAKINGILNNLLICFLSSCNNDLCFFRYNLTEKNTINQITIPIKIDVLSVRNSFKSGCDFKNGFNPFNNKYTENTNVINPT
jgi:hypothetical protein